MKRHLVLALLGLAILALALHDREPRTLRVGILHSLTGTMASSEKPLVDTALLAIDSLNARGGVGGARLVPVVADGRSDPAVFAAEARRLIEQEKVAVIFGGWTSASRKAMRAVVEENNHLLVYPLQYEGMEQSPNILYSGEAPNQQIIPAVQWAATHVGKRFYLVGSDYVFPRAAHAIIRDQMARLGAEVVGEDFVPLGETHFGALAARIRQARPDIVLNTINGDSNRHFFVALRGENIFPAKLPVMSFSVIAPLDNGLLPGDFSVWSYFSNIDTPESRAFVAQFKRRFGATRDVSSPMEATWSGVHLWARAAAANASPSAARAALNDLELDAPGGRVRVDGATGHLWKTARIGRLNALGEFDPLWTSTAPLRPEPWPASRPQKAWELFLDGLYRRWGGHWVAPSGD